MKSWFSNTFPEYKKLPKSGKFMAWLTFVQGVVWLILASIQSVQGLITTWHGLCFLGFYFSFWVYWRCLQHGMRLNSVQ